MMTETKTVVATSSTSKQGQVDVCRGAINRRVRAREISRKIHVHKAVRISNVFAGTGCSAGDSESRGVIQILSSRVAGADRKNG